MSKCRDKSLTRDRRGVTVNQPVRPAKLARARSFRKAPTEAEARTWALLRNRGILGLKFRRQQIVDGFIVDFYCAKHRLIFEVDGEVHLTVEQAGYDAERDEYLTATGFHVLRLSNSGADRETLTNLLRRFLETRSPSPARERGPGGEV